MNFDINSSLLGKISKNTDQYNPKVLFRIPHSEMNKTIRQ
jgi:NADPH-dependent 7-cyano-7-deazaguanine reductase QueF-like protein